MKKVIFCILTGSLLLMHSACLTIVHPLNTTANLVFEKRLTGTWQFNNDMITIEKMDESHIYKELNKANIGGTDNGIRVPLQGKEKQDSIFYSRSYSVTYKRNGVTYYMSAAIVRIDNTLYMDLLPLMVDDPKQPDGTGYEFSYDYLPTFSAAKLEINGNNAVSIKFMDGDYIKEQVQNNRAKISHEENRLFGTFVITASSEELQRFLEKYGNDDRLYNNKNSITLTRKG